MLELYHNINSVCAQKVRIALEEKGQSAKEHILTLRGDQNDPAYMKLNPNGGIPNLIYLLGRQHTLDRHGLDFGNRYPS